MDKSELRARLKKYLDEVKYYYTDGAGGESFKIPFAPEKLRNFGELTMHLFPRDDGISCYCFLPIKAKSNDYGKVSELIVRLQHSFLTGGFQLDFQDGTIFFWLFTPGQLIEANGKSAFDRLLRVPYNETVCLFDAFVDVLVRGVSPEEAVKKIEG